MTTIEPQRFRSKDLASRKQAPCAMLLQENALTLRHKVFPAYEPAHRLRIFHDARACPSGQAEACVVQRLRVG